MKKISLLIFVAVVLTAMFMNIQNSFEGYGIVKMKTVHDVILADDSGTGTGTGDEEDDEGEANITCSQFCDKPSGGVCWTTNDKYDPEKDPVSKRCKFFGQMYSSCSCKE